MTTEQLDAYRGITAEIKAIEAEIENMYHNVRSPSLSADGSRSSAGTTSKTERTVFRSMELQDKLQGKLQELKGMRADIEEWLDTVEDTYVRACIRHHYIIGRSWKETSRLVFGESDYYRARKQVFRYMRTESGR